MILKEIEEFLVEREMASHVFGKRCMNDDAFVYRLREGNDIKTRTIDKVRAFMARERASPLGKRRAAESRSAA